MGEDESSYLNYVNVSGFPFQLAVEYEINKSESEHQWQVVGREHFWKDNNTGKEGFIDLVLANTTYTYRAIIECKRQLEKSWIFLVPSDHQPQNLATLLWSQRFSFRKKVDQAWAVLRIDPLSFVSAFCTMQGQSQNDKPMLERVASDVLLMIESLAKEESGYVGARIGAFPIIYVPIIVTTAKLLVCKFQESDLDLQTGTLPKDKVEFIKVPLIQFQKGLQSNIDSEGKSLANVTGSITNLKQLNEFNQRSVFIVQANELTNFLKGFQLQKENSWIDYVYPWKEIENALRRNPNSEF